MAPAEIIRRVVGKAGVPGLALVVVGLALTGGAVSGWIEQGPVTSNGTPVGAGPAATEVATTTSSTVAGSTVAGSTVDVVKQQIVEDLGIDLTAQGLDPDLRRRAALAMTSSSVATRRSLIEQSWAPDQVARIEGDYDRIVIAHASNPTVPSVTDATFIVTTWQSATVTGTSAQGVVVGHFRLHEPGNVAARPHGGYVDVFDRTWTVTVSWSGGRWRLEGRSPS